jgi:hypothetical protein
LNKFGTPKALFTNKKMFFLELFASPVRDACVLLYAISCLLSNEEDKQGCRFHQG